MSELSAVQVPKPRDEQAFERCSLVLWRCILNDEGTYLYGRRGQRQHGVDIVGCRDGDPRNVVGIQCKLKGEGQQLTENEVRAEVEKAFTFHPLLAEYAIVTTAPDDAKLQSLARELSASISEGRSVPLQISVIGWENLQQEVQRHPEALRAFDPSHTGHGEKILQKVEDVPEQVAEKLSPHLELIRQDIANLGVQQVTVESTAMDSEYEALITDYVSLIPNEPEIALESLQRLQSRLDANVGSRIRFRTATNIAACRLELGDVERAAAEFISACDIAPEERKAIANKALGHLLGNDWLRARDIAKKALDEQPENASLGAVFIRSLIHDDGVGDPMSLIPEAIRRTPEVEQAYVLWLVHRVEPQAWWEAAIQAHGRHPEVAELKEAYANALLSRAIGGEAYAYGLALQGNGLPNVEKAIEVYETLWDEMRSRKRRQRGDLTSVPLNLMLAYRILGRNESATALGWEAAERFPEDMTVKEQLAVLLVERGETDKALQVISDLEDNHQVVAVRFKIAVTSKDWNSVLELADRYAANAPQSERLVAHATKLVARAELADPEEARHILTLEHGEFSGHTRSLIILGQSARTRGFEDISQSLFDAAVASVQHGDADYPSRLAVAEEAMVRGHPGIAADALDGRVALYRDSEELRLLAHAYVLDVPIRQRALRFFDALHSEIKNLAIFLKLEGILHFNRGVPNVAATVLVKALNADCRIDTLMCLIRALYQSNRKDEIRELLQSRDVDALYGTALDRINVSHALLDFSETERALGHGYTSLSEGLENAEVVMKFIGLVLRATSADWEPDKEPKVESGTWVRLAHGSKGSFEALVGEAQDRPWGQAVPTDNAFISQCLNLRKGDEFEIQTSLGSKETWCVSEIKPRWLQAFHHLTSDFGQRFPEAKGFAAVTIADDDIEPALEQIRRNSAMAREQADFYLRNNIPLVMAAGDRPGGIVAFAQYISSLGEQVRVCTGTADERDRALELIRENERRGAVIDAFTAWHAAALGVLPVLRERLGQIAIPANELTRLSAMTEQVVEGGNDETMTMGYQDGEYFGFVETPEDRERRLDHVIKLIQAVESSCTVEPLQFPDRFSELGEKLVRLPPSGAFASAVIAGSSRLLLCEDFVMRRLAQQGFGANGVWIQAVLFDAEQAGTISFTAYADAVVYLAHFRHSYVSVSAPVLLSVFERDISRDLVQLEVLCSFVGDANAEMLSHTAIVAEFINTIWANAQPLIVADEFPVDSKTRKGTNLVIRALLEERRSEDWANWAAALYRGLGTLPVTIRRRPQGELARVWRRGVVRSGRSA